MARLLVLRGESPHREIELTDRTVRIGRSPDNDLILEDTGKSVSRNHAEIRYENGRYVLIDRESQNGVWVSGSRSPYVVLEPNVVATVGPYRLMLDSTVSSATGEGDLTEYGGPGRESGATYDVEKRPEVSQAAQSSRIPVKDQRRGQPNWFAQQPTWMLGAVGAAAVGGLAVVIALLVGGRAGPPTITEQLDGLEARINSGDCEGPLVELEALLASSPVEPRALELKGRAEACTQLTPPPPPVPTDTGERLKTAAFLIENGDCLGALTEHIDPVLEVEPANPEAVELKIKAEACKQASSPKPPPTSPPKIAADPTAKPLPPESGGLTPFSGELDKDYRTRVGAMRDRYAEAASALSAMEYQKAVMLFEGIVRDAGPKYLDAGDRLAEARNRQKEGAQKSLQAGRDLESKGEWDRAIEAFRRAGQGDSSLKVEVDINRVTGKKVTAGRQACDDANARYGYGRNAEALQLYQEAVKLLPSDDPCITTARERFPALRR